MRKKSALAAFLVHKKSAIAVFLAQKKSALAGFLALVVPFILYYTLKPQIPAFQAITLFSLFAVFIFLSVIFSASEKLLERHKLGVGLLEKIFLPVAIAVIGWQFSAAMKQAEIGVKYVEIVTNILTPEPFAEGYIDTDEKKLREWATDVVNHYSAVPMNDSVKDAVINRLSLFGPSISIQFKLTVTDEDRNPIQDAHIDIIKDICGSKTAIARQTTDSSGVLEYTQTNASDPNFFLTVSKDGYDTLTSSIMFTSPAILSVTLKRTQKGPLTQE